MEGTKELPVQSSFDIQLDQLIRFESLRIILLDSLLYSLGSWFWPLTEGH